MKNFHSLCLALLLFACSPLDDDLGRPRSDTRHGPESHLPRKRHDPPDIEAERADTLLWFAAVRFPEDYDWQRDSAYGSVPYTLLLYKDFSPVLELSSSPRSCFSPDPDRHHILSGHLYTEVIAGAHTCVGRDGSELFCFEGREYLVGLLEDGNDLYTLSRPARGGGFSLRKNGSLLLSHPDGIPFGDLQDPSYAPTGALYRDAGQVVFGFRSGGLLQEDLCLVRDGVVSTLDIAKSGVLDFKIRDGRNCLLRTDFQNYRLSEGRIWPEGDGVAVTGRFIGRTGSFSGWMPAVNQERVRQLCPEEAVMYRCPEGSFAVSIDNDGNVHWYGSDGSVQGARYSRFLSPACAFALGGKLWIALASRDAGQIPRIHIGDKTLPVALHGYISRMTAEIIPPN